MVNDCSSRKTPRENIEELTKKYEIEPDIKITSRKIKEIGEVFL